MHQTDVLYNIFLYKGIYNMLLGSTKLITLSSIGSKNGVSPDPRRGSNDSAAEPFTEFVRTEVSSFEAGGKPPNFPARFTSL